MTPTAVRRADPPVPWRTRAVSYALMQIEPHPEVLAISGDLDRLRAEARDAHASSAEPLRLVIQPAPLLA